MATRTDVSLELLDGGLHTYSTTTFMCVADRVAFERHFGVTSGELSNLREAFDATGAPLPGADISGLHEAWTTFFVWRTTVRALAYFTTMTFDDFCEQIAEISMTENAEALDPTQAALQPA